jgi:hypothetical protein
MESSPVKATFRLAGLPATAAVKVLGEDRELKAMGKNEVRAYHSNVTKLVGIMSGGNFCR